MRVGYKKKVLHRFRHPPKIFIGAADDRRKTEYADVLRRFSDITSLSVVGRVKDADTIVHLIDENRLLPEMTKVAGKDARIYASKNDPQCATIVQSTAGGDIVHVESFIIVDKGEEIFRNCAYHETLHIFGLTSHANDNKWTTLNQTRVVGYLTIYDRWMLTMLYDEKLRPGMTRAEVRKALPRLIKDLRDQHRVRDDP